MQGDTTILISFIFIGSPIKSDFIALFNKHSTILIGVTTNRYFLHFHLIKSFLLLVYTPTAHTDNQGHN